MVFRKLDVIRKVNSILVAVLRKYRVSFLLKITIIQISNNSTCHKTTGIKKTRLQIVTDLFLDEFSFQKFFRSRFFSF